MTTTEMEAMMVRPAETLGPVLSSRSVAAELREVVEAELQAAGEVVVDFEGVEIISPSFADEFFAKLPHDAVEAKSVRFENLDDEHSALARFVFNGRAAGPPTRAQ